MLKTKTPHNKKAGAKKAQKKAPHKKSPKQQKRAFASATTVNPLVEKAEYAVRGELVIKADAFQAKIAANPDSHGLPFNHIIKCNIGNPHELKQKPLSFIRQVLALCHYPELMSNPAIAASMPADAIARAKKYLSTISTTGSYTHSKGLRVVRDEVADFIKRRDGHAVDPESIWLTDGASAGVKMVLQSLMCKETDGVLTPIPQYPLYSATMQLLNAQLVGYYLDESSGWSLNVGELQKQLDAANAKGIDVKAITIINPGNPTGQCLPEDTIKDVVKWCEQRNITILADEVYQDNAYSTTPFTSFHKVVRDLNSKVSIFSFHSVSKGVYGECGLRGGFFQAENVPEHFMAQMYKMSSISLCSNVTGQLTMGLVVNPPQPGEPSYEQDAKERGDIFNSLKRRALKVSGALNQMEGISCQPIEGALYAFPQLKLPKKAIQAAKEAGKAADTFYALQLLDNTGICVVSGSGFGQAPETFHFRTTILPDEAEMDTVIDKMNVFHKKFMDQYRD